MNTKYSNWKMWYYVLCMVLTLQLAACSEETHDEYTAAPEIEDTYIEERTVPHRKPGNSDRCDR